MTVDERVGVNDAAREASVCEACPEPAADLSIHRMPASNDPPGELSPSTSLPSSQRTLPGISLGSFELSVLPEAAGAPAPLPLLSPQPADMRKRSTKMTRAANLTSCCTKSSYFS